MLKALAYIFTENEAQNYTDWGWGWIQAVVALRKRKTLSPWGPAPCPVSCGLAVQLFGAEITVRPNPASSAGHRILQPGKSALRPSTACGCSLYGSHQGEKMPTNPNTCQSKQQCRYHQLGQNHTVLKFRKSILNSSSVQMPVRDVP